MAKPKVKNTTVEEQPVRMTKEERAVEMQRLADEAAAEEAAEQAAAAAALVVDRSDDSEEGVLKRVVAIEARFDQLAAITPAHANKLADICARFFGV